MVKTSKKYSIFFMITLFSITFGCFDSNDLKEKREEKKITIYISCQNNTRAYEGLVGCGTFNDVTAPITINVLCNSNCAASTRLFQNIDENYSIISDNFCNISGYASK